jgi:PleD family two-component response regulator
MSGKRLETDAMLTNLEPGLAVRTQAGESTAPTRKVLIVNGNARSLAMLDTVVEAGHYDVVFVESGEYAYSHIRQNKPDLVILCLHPDDHNGCLLLSMLKLDDETRDVPILTCAIENDEDDPEDDQLAEAAESEIFPVTRTLQMN